MHPMTILEPGTNLRDTYEVERFLGEGAFAEVYRVKHRFLGRQALKVFKRVGMSIADIHEMLGEAILLSKIGHPNIVRVFDANVFDTDRGPCGYFTMEYVAGGSLQKFWQSHGSSLVPIQTSLDLIKQVCRGLALAHRESPPIVHRDIKPQNILVGYEADGLRARISDFGLAKSVNPLTMLATTAGTVAFKPPEAFSDAKGDSCASDVWALGATLYMLLTDKLPFETGTQPDGVAPQVPSKPLVPPSRINPHATPHLDAILAKSLQLEASARYQNAQQLLEALEEPEPRPASPSRAKAIESGPSKTALGTHSDGSPSAAGELSERARTLAKGGRLREAADLMEEAFNKSPTLRDRYAETVKLWRRGIAM